MYRFWIAVLSTMIILSSLAACAQDHPQPNQQEQSAEEEISAEYHYEILTTPIQVNGKIQEILSFTIHNEEGWFSALIEQENKKFNAMYRLDLDSGVAKQITLPIEHNAEPTIFSIKEAENGDLWVGCHLKFFVWALPDGMEKESPDAFKYREFDRQTIIIYHLDKTGNVIEELPIETDLITNPKEMLIGEQDRIYLNDYMTICVVDPHGKEIQPLSVKNATLFDLGNNMIAVRSYSALEGIQTWNILNQHTGELGEKLDIPKEASKIYPGYSDYRYFYQLKGAMFGQPSDKKEPSVGLFNLLECNINPENFEHGTMLENGALVGVEKNMAADGSRTEGCSLIFLQPVLNSVHSNVQELTLSCIGLSPTFNKMIVDFNRSHDSIKVIVHEYGTDASYEEACTKLNIDMMSGNVPDILVTEGLRHQSVCQMGKKGLLEDLWPWIDTKIGRDKLMDHVLEVMSEDGKLYQLTDGFAIATATCYQQYAKDQISWTLEEMLECADTLDKDMAIWGPEVTKNDALEIILIQNLDAFVDYDNQLCYFSTPRFIDLLRFANKFSADGQWEDDYERIQNGQQLMHRCWIMNIFSFLQELALYGGEASFIGYPTNGSSGSAFMIYPGAAITTACKNKEAAWELISQMLYIETSDRYFSINRDEFEADVQKWMTPEWSEEGLEKPKAEVYGAPIYAMTQNQKQLLMEVYSNCNKLFDQDIEVWTLVKEEAEWFFAGKKTAEETAELIQNRVDLYLKEQRNT